MFPTSPPRPALTAVRPPGRAPVRASSGALSACFPAAGTRKLHRWPGARCVAEAALRSCLAGRTLTLCRRRSCRRPGPARRSCRSPPLLLLWVEGGGPTRHTLSAFSCPRSAWPGIPKYSRWYGSTTTTEMSGGRVSRPCANERL